MYKYFKKCIDYQVFLLGYICLFFKNIAESYMVHNY